MTNNMLWGMPGKELSSQKIFPLEPLGVIAGKDKISSYIHKTL
jgi:hypothetical protein